MEDRSCMRNEAERRYLLGAFISRWVISYICSPVGHKEIICAQARMSSNASRTLILTFCSTVASQFRGRRSKLIIHHETREHSQTLAFAVSGHIC